MTTSQKVSILSKLSSHVQGLIAVANACGLKAVGIDGIMYASIEADGKEYLYPLKETTTLDNFKKWLGY